MLQFWGGISHKQSETLNSYESVQNCSFGRRAFCHRRVVFIARVIEEMSVEETAAVFALRPKTVKTRVHRARRLLRDQLETQIGGVLMDVFSFAEQANAASA
jgi:hypothetical protein